MYREPGESCAALSPYIPATVVLESMRLSGGLFTEGASNETADGSSNELLWMFGATMAIVFLFGGYHMRQRHTQLSAVRHSEEEAAELRKRPREFQPNE